MVFVQGIYDHLDRLRAGRSFGIMNIWATGKHYFKTEISRMLISLALVFYLIVILRISMPNCLTWVDQLPRYFSKETSEKASHGGD